MDRPRKRRWWFPLVAVLLGFSPLWLSELTLRFVGLPIVPAADDPLVDLNQLKPLFVDDQQGKYRIPDSRYNFFRPEQFSVNKDDDEFRIFVLGGSTVQGRPYQTETAFPMWLELALETSATTNKRRRAYNTINCGGISYASYRLAPILDEVLGYQPDLIILYTGHNEFLEERTYATLKYVLRPLATTMRYFDELRIVKVLQQITAEAVQPSWVAEPEFKTRLDVAGGLAAFNRDDFRRGAVIAHFRQTLDRMVSACKARDVPVIVCVPVSNLDDTPPFKISSAPELSEQLAVEFAIIWQASLAGEITLNERIALCEQMLEIDPHHAGAAYVLGKLLLENGQPASSERYLTIARDWDVCPLRAPSEIENTVREVGQKHKIPVVELPELFRDSSPDRRLSDRLFADHVHPSIGMHRQIAIWLMQTMERMRLIEVSPSSTRTRRLAFEQHLESLDQAYYARGRQRLEGLRQWAAGRAGQLAVD